MVLLKLLQALGLKQSDQQSLQRDSSISLLQRCEHCVIVLDRQNWQVCADLHTTLMELQSRKNAGCFSNLQGVEAEVVQQGYQPRLGRCQAPNK